MAAGFACSAGDAPSLSQTMNGKLLTEPYGATFVTTRAFLGVAGAIAIAGWGATKSTTATTPTTAAATTKQSPPPAWERGTPAPKVTPALIRQAGYGLTVADANVGTVDEVFGAVPANFHVNPSVKTLNDQYARFGRCMGEYAKIQTNSVVRIWSVPLVTGASESGPADGRADVDFAAAARGQIEVYSEAYTRASSTITNKPVVREFEKLADGAGDLNRLATLCDANIVNHALASGRARESRGPVNSWSRLAGCI